MKTKSLGFIGGGRITKIMLQAFVNRKAEFRSISVYDVSPNILLSLKKQFPHVNEAKNATDAAAQDIVFIALHPPVIKSMIATLEDSFLPAMIGVSLAPKVTIEQLTQMTGKNKWARIIPNAPSYINQGHNPFALSPAIDDSEEKMLGKIFSLLGNSFQVNEELLEAYAIIAAMSPTYFWYQWELLVKLGTSFGMGEEACKRALNETLSASVNLLLNSNLEYEEVADLIPVKPLQEIENFVSNSMQEKLSTLYEKISPQSLTIS